MARPAAYVLIAGVAALAGCGGGSKQAATTTSRPTAACARLQRDVGLVSTVVSGSVEAMTQSLHPKELAQRTGEAQRNIAAAADALARLTLPPSLAQSRTQLVAGLRRFAADFGRAEDAVARNDLATAAADLKDPAALTKVRVATDQIDRTCRS